MSARRADWKAEPLPPAYGIVAIHRYYDTEEFARLRGGLIPQDMDDKWFLYYEEPVLYLHRSWTGHCIAEVQFAPEPGGGARVVEARVNQNPEQYRGGAGIVLTVLDWQAARGWHSHDFPPDSP